MADSLATNMAYICSTQLYNQIFITTKNLKERTKLNFTATEYYTYSNSIKLVELQSALKTCKLTAPGEDSIHYSTI